MRHPTFSLTRHAQMRRKQMGVTETRIFQAIDDPDTTYPGGDAHPPGRVLYQRGDLVVVTEGTDVLTILWHRREGRDVTDSEAVNS